MRSFPFLAALCMAGVLLSTAAAQTERLAFAEFDTLHKQMTSAQEPWQSLPWHLSLLEAQAQAAKEKKPIYMLCRSGHPLGCV